MVHIHTRFIVPAIIVVAASYRHTSVRAPSLLSNIHKQLGFQDQVLPFSLMCFLAGSMSHADQAVVQVLTDLWSD